MEYRKIRYESIDDGRIVRITLSLPRADPSDGIVSWREARQVQPSLKDRA